MVHVMRIRTNCASMADIDIWANADRYTCTFASRSAGMSVIADQMRSPQSLEWPEIIADILRVRQCRTFDEVEKLSPEKFENGDCLPSWVAV